VTEVVELARLLASFGSADVAATIAVLPTPRQKFGTTVKTTVAVAPLVRLPTLQLTCPPPAQLPWLGVADTKRALAGVPSNSTTFDAELGPSFLTRIVIEVFTPVDDAAGAVRETATSAGVPLRSLTSAFRST
jgi:hypothetical protein